MDWACGIRGMCAEFWWGDLKKGGHLKDLGVAEDNIKMKCHGLDTSGSGYGPVAGCYKQDNEHKDVIKRGTFLD